MEREIAKANVSHNKNNYFLASVSAKEDNENSNAVGVLSLLELGLQQGAPNVGHINDGNQTALDLPSDMRFNDAHLISIIVYSILMVFSAISNVTVLVTILRFRRRGRGSRISLFVLHLAVADLLVTFLLMPLEIAWNWTVSWTAGDGMCRIMAFFRTFGLYLSGFLLVCISLDRYFAILRPLDIYGADRRGRLMLALAWTGSVVCSIPQALVFHVERHPNITWYEQCVTFNSFPTPELELMYMTFGFIFLYGFPFVMIVGCYTCILWKICMTNEKSSTENLRRSNTEVLNRAKMKTLKLTVTIVATFCLCWTPYNIMALWYMIDRQSAQQLDQRIQKGLFVFACTNSCFNPLVYGYFHFRKQEAVKTSSCYPSHPHLPQDRMQSGKMETKWSPREDRK